MNRLLKQLLVAIVSMTIVVSNIPLTGAKASDKKVIAVPYADVDDTVAVEVFSESGKMEHKEIDVDSLYQVEDNTEDSNIPVSKISDDGVKYPDELKNCAPVPTYNFQDILRDKQCQSSGRIKERKDNGERQRKMYNLCICSEWNLC